MATPNPTLAAKSATMLASTPLRRVGGIPYATRHSGLTLSSPVRRVHFDTPARTWSNPLLRIHPGCLAGEGGCFLDSLSYIHQQEYDGEYYNLTQAEIESYPELALVANDETVRVDCERMDRIWSHLEEQGAVTMFEIEISYEVAWIAWDGQKQGMTHQQQVA